MITRTVARTINLRGVIDAHTDLRFHHAAAVASTLAPLSNRKTAGRLAVAVFLGKARLIDNIPLPRIP